MSMNLAFVALLVLATASTIRAKESLLFADYLNAVLDSAAQVLPLVLALLAGLGLLLGFVLVLSWQLAEFDSYLRTSFFH